MSLPDLQDQLDTRGIELDRVGIAGLRYPVTFADGVTTQSAIAEFDVTVRLPAERRGTHMSRMVQLVDVEMQTLDPREWPHVLKVAAHRLDVNDVSITAALAFATRVQAPQSGIVSWQTHDLKLAGALADGQTQLATTVTTDITSLCPCSKAISDYGAHNQRSRVSLTIIGDGDEAYPLDAAAIADLIRTVGSSPVYPIVKRPDERILTMDAHDHPSFVEDIARDLSRNARQQGHRHAVTVRNLESIHSHDAVAAVAQ